MSKYYSKKRKKSKLIVILLAIIIIAIAISYALFSAQLNITGIVTGNARFKVYFIEAWVEDARKGNSRNKCSTRSR